MNLVNSLNTLIFLSLILLAVSFISNVKWLLVVCMVLSALFLLVILKNIFTRDKTIDENIIDNNLEPKEYCLELIQKLTQKNTINDEFRTKLLTIKNLIIEIESKNGKIQPYLLDELIKKLELYIDLSNDSVKIKKTRQILNEIEVQGIPTIIESLNHIYANILNEIKDDENFATEAIKMKQKMDGLK